MTTSGRYLRLHVHVCIDNRRALAQRLFHGAAREVPMTVPAVLCASACALCHGRIAQLTEHEDVIKLLLRGAPHLGLALGPAPAMAGPARSQQRLSDFGITSPSGTKMFLRLHHVTHYVRAFDIQFASYAFIQRYASSSICYLLTSNVQHIFYKYFFSGS